MNRKSNIKRIACNVKLAKILSKVTTRRSLSGCQRNLVKIQEFFHLSFVLIIIIMTIFNEETFSLKSGLQKGPRKLKIKNLQ